MKTFNRTSLPESITYNGETYVNDIELANSCKNYNGRIMKLSVESTTKTKGKKAVIVNVLSKNLKGKTDLYNKPYEPTEWVYTRKV